MWQAVCDGCGLKGVGTEIIAWDSSEGAELEAIESGWQWIGRKLFCPDCMDKIRAQEEAADDEVTYMA